MDNKEFKNKKQPELTDNRTAWRSDNQGVEETFIQTSRRGGDGQAVQRVHVAGGDLVVPHLCMDKPGGTTGE